MGQYLAACIRDPKSKDVLKIILNRVPARRPGRQAEVKPRLVDVFDVGRNVKLLAARIGKRDRVIDLESVFLSQNALSAYEQDNNEQERERAKYFSHNFEFVFCCITTD